MANLNHNPRRHLKSRLDKFPDDGSCIHLFIYLCFISFFLKIWGRLTQDRFVDKNLSVGMDKGKHLTPAE